MNEQTNHLAAESHLAALEGWFRTLIREEIQAVQGQNGEKGASLGES